MRLLTLSTLALAATAFGAAPAEDAVSLKAVSYDDLLRTVHEHQGQVIVVDFWAEY